MSLSVHARQKTVLMTYALYRNNHVMNSERSHYGARGSHADRRRQFAKTVLVLPNIYYHAIKRSSVCVFRLAIIQAEFLYPSKFFWHCVLKNSSSHHTVVS